MNVVLKPNRTGFRTSVRARQALTIVELLVALVAALILLTAVITVLGRVTEGVYESRGAIEATNRLRSAVIKLRSDLEGATCPTLVWQRQEMGNGYFEYVEGPTYEPTNDNLVGDVDDILAFTTRAPAGQMFSGLAGGQVINSDKAEVVWFIYRPSAKTYPDGTVVYNLYRRHFLIVNKAGQGISAMPPLQSKGSNNQDIAVFNGNIAAGLGDLSARENRAFHSSRTAAMVPTPFADGSSRQGEDIVLTDVLSFDVKIFDPDVTIGATGNQAVLPDDPGYTANNGARCGAFVDLGRGNASRFFARTPLSTSAAAGIAGNILLPASPPTYDTWSFDYEFGGRYTDGQDNDTTNGVDDAGERESMPPYPYPMRGIQIKLRIYEPSTKQIREVTVEETFVP